MFVHQEYDFEIWGWPVTVAAITVVASFEMLDQGQIRYFGLAPMVSCLPTACAIFSFVPTPSVPETSTVSPLSYPAYCDREITQRLGLEWRRVQDKQYSPVQRSPAYLRHVEQPAEAPQVSVAARPSSGLAHGLDGLHQRLAWMGWVGS